MESNCSLDCTTSLNQPTLRNIDDIQKTTVLVESSEYLNASASVSTQVRRTKIIKHTYEDQQMLVLPKVPPCKHCGAHKFYKETPRFCCSGGEVILAETELPSYIVHLFTGTDEKSKRF
ncbi:hypothetical protein LIER_31862 [Lithospermum erythrorhizon]|uniref:Uncharacterized protein n=1 Tax=Lithospermum erythrorhizon TaxID=34254 RepID=A0AAV3RUE7_LITER